MANPTPTPSQLATSIEPNPIAAAIAAGEALGALRTRGDVHRAVEGAQPFMLVPAGLVMTPVENTLPAPLLARSVVKTDDAASFIAYINRYKNSDTVVFADLTGRKFEAVIDYHQAPGLATATEVRGRWGKHRVTLGCDTTEDWKAWAGKSGAPMEQVEFARFIEDHIPNIAQPDGNSLLLMATTLEAKKDVAFRASTRLTNGEHQIRYEETITGTAGSQSGQIDIPNAFVLGLEPFQGVGLRRVDARFRYRINAGTLKLWFELVRANDVVEKAFTDVVQQIRAGLGDTLVVSGAAPSIA